MKKLPPWVLIAIIVLVLVVIGIVLYSFKWRPWSQLDRPKIDRPPLGNLEEALKRVDELPYLVGKEAKEEIVAAIIGKGDPEMCRLADRVMVDGIDEGVICRNNIAYELARSRRDLSACDRLDGKLITVEGCKREVILLKLRDKKDVTVCRELTDGALRAWCEERLKVIP
jgi:hypothetical protein